MKKISKLNDGNPNGPKSRKNLQELRLAQFSSNPLETAAAQTGEAPETPDAQVDSSDHYEQASQIMQRFLDHYQSAKKVCDLLRPFLDVYRRCQEDLKKFNISGPQLHKMDLDIQVYLDRVNKSLTLDQRLTEAAKVGIKELLLAGINTEIGKLKELLNNPQSFGPDTETILGQRQRALANMTKWNQKLAKFSKKLEQSNITTLDQLRNNLTDLLSEIRKEKKRMAEKDLEDNIKTIGRKFDMVSRAPQIASNEDISLWRKQFGEAIAYKEQESISTADGLIHQYFILNVINKRLDEIIETISQKEIYNALKAYDSSQIIGDIKPNDLGTCIFHNFKIGSVLDEDALKWLANDFHEALNREKQPQTLYRILYFLLREPEAIDKFNDVYQENYKQTLETALNERFKKPEDRPQLEYALQFIKKGDIRSEQTIEPRPPIKQNANEFSTVAQWIHLALHPASGEPRTETVYAALTSLERHTESLCHVDAHYSSLYGKGLKSDIENTLKGEAKDHALFLLGDPIGERNAKSWLEAVNWHKVLSKQTFDRGDGVHVPIPYDGLLQGGRTWTHILGQALKEAGLRSKKIIALSLYNNANGWKQPGLDVYMNLAPDRPDGKNTRIHQRMALLIEVETPFGAVELVLDPSLSSKPLTIKQWMSMMGQDTFECMSLDDYLIKRRDEPFQANPADKHPADKPYVVIANRNTPDIFYSPKEKNSLSDQDASEYYHLAGEAAMSNDAAWMPYHNIAQLIRDRIQDRLDNQSAEDLFNTAQTNFLEDGKKFRSDYISTKFSSAFPNLYQELQDHLAKTQVSAPIVERFKKFLSGKHTLSGAERDQRNNTDRGEAKKARDQTKVLQRGGSQQPREKIHIEHIQPASGMFRDCTVASVRDFKALANNLHHALKPGKSPERVYRVLFFLLCENKAVEKLENAFQKKDGRSLETALMERFGEDSPQLKYALHLIGKEDTDSDQVMDRRPVSQEEYIALSEHIHTALLKKDFETVYRALTPFQRNTPSLCEFNELYKLHKHGPDPDVQADKDGLQADMKRYLAGDGDSLKFALFLSGNDAIATKVVSRREAKRLAQMAAQQTFERIDGTRVPIPYDVSGVDGSECLHRAYVVGEVLTELGFKVEKAFMYFGSRSRARFVTSDGHGWWYHTACCLRVKTTSGTEVLVIDSSSGDVNKDIDKLRLRTIQEWAKGHGKRDVKFISFKEFQRLMEEKRLQDPKASASDWRPIDQPYTFITNLDYIDIPDLAIITEASKIIDKPNRYSHTVYNREGAERLARSTYWAPYCRVAKHISKAMRESTIQNEQDAEEFFKAITEEFEESLKEFHLEVNLSPQFGDLFPNAYKSFITHLQERKVSPTMIAIFDHFLAGYSEGPARVKLQQTDWEGPMQTHTEVNWERPRRTDTEETMLTRTDTLDSTGNNFWQTKHKSI